MVVLIAAAAVVSVMTAPARTTGAAFTAPLIVQLGVSRTDISTVRLIGTLVGAPALPVVDRALDRYGVTVVMSVVGAVFGVILPALSFVDGLVGLTAGSAGVDVGSPLVLRFAYLLLWAVVRLRWDVSYGLVHHGLSTCVARQGRAWVELPLPRRARHWRG